MTTEKNRNVLLALLLIITVVSVSLQLARRMETMTAPDGILLGEVVERWRTTYNCADVVVRMTSNGNHLSVNISCREVHREEPSAGNGHYPGKTGVTL